MKPQGNSLSSTTHLTIQHAVFPAGTWTTAFDSEITPTRSVVPIGNSSGYLERALPFTAPLDTPCFRARITTDTGTSAWSAVKCAATTPQADNVHGTWANGTTAAVVWSDHSVNDVATYVEARDTRAGTTTVTRLPGTRGTSGTRTAQISGLLSGTTCLRVWAVDTLPGRSGGVYSIDDWNPDVPLYPTIYPSAPSCLDVPYS